MVSLVKLQMINTGLVNHIQPDLEAANLFQYFPCEIFRFNLKIMSQTILPPYKGGVFRDAFGNAFRKSVCAKKQVKNCDTCMIKRQCLYGYTCKKNHPVRGVGSNESGQGVSMVPVRNQY